MKTMKPTFIMGMLAICMGMMSCQDDEDTNISTIKPGTYSADIIVNSESGSTNYSRGIDVKDGIFTSTYEQNHIYLHHVKADGNGEVLYIPMRTDCGEDKCFNIQVTKNKNGDNISYTIIAKDGTPQSMTINANEQIYFSTMKDQTWESEILKKQSPIGDILKQPTNVDDIKSREILRSGLYTGERLLELMTGDTQYIDLTRHVTGFKINILFTNANVVENEDHIIDIKGWHDALGENVNPEDFFIKIYFGPNFAQWYDILNDKSAGSGYYASNNETYVSFEEVKQTYNNKAYTGYGYNTTNTLLSPLYIGEANKEFRIYMCIKYKEEGQEFYTEIRPKNLTMNPNTIHHMILAFDVHDLIPIVTEKGGTYSTRSSSSTFQKIDIKPIKVICN
ncbi:unknown [Bacteroides sp. CAG:702]|nr:unknown [Bacteroides sp. CAG:702]